MYVIGTAGHVDHGKSTLVEALTGIDPDRLAEEKAREMTIDLGFAWLDLLAEGVAVAAESGLPAPAGAELSEVGVVDVPGHRDFIENMLAGVGGIDLALFVVAADEGVMPQTAEHLAILDLLEVSGGVIALTKTDLVTEPDWLELVTLDVSEAMSGTVLANAPIVPVSARTGAGLPALRRALAQQLLATPARPDTGRPRLSIDRVFSLPGFGTIVTGTLVGGSLRVGDAVEIHPAGLKARIRGLQTHRTRLDTARPGSRVAINLTGVNKEELQRGDVVAAPGLVRGTLLLDAVYRHLPEADAPLKHNSDVKLFLGAAEVLARTRILGAAQIAPGETGWLQLALRQPAATVRGDRFILRRPSPGATLGGGQVLDPHPGRRHRRFRPEVLARLQTLSQGTPADLLLQALSRMEPSTPAGVFKQSGLEKDAASAAWQELIDTQQVVLFEQQAMSRAGWERLRQRMLALVHEYHAQYPLRPGISREELRSRLQIPSPLLNALLSQCQATGDIDNSGSLVCAAGFAISFTPAQEAAIARLMAQFAQSGINSPNVKECKNALGEDVYYALVSLGQLQPLREDVVYTTPFYRELQAQLLAHLAAHGRINAAEMRDMFQTSRKYAIAWLEHLDELRLTRRVGDDRELIER